MALVTVVSTREGRTSKVGWQYNTSVSRHDMIAIGFTLYIGRNVSTMIYHKIAENTLK